jgi:hypothetical protein
MLEWLRAHHRQEDVSEIFRLFADCSKISLNISSENLTPTQLSWALLSPNLGCSIELNG